MTLRLRCPRTSLTPLSWGSRPSSHALESDRHDEGTHEVRAGVGTSVGCGRGRAGEHGRALPDVRREPADGLHVGRALSRGGSRCRYGRREVSPAQDVTDRDQRRGGRSDRRGAQALADVGATQAARSPGRAESGVRDSQRERDEQGAQAPRSDTAAATAPPELARRCGGAIRWLRAAQRRLVHRLQGLVRVNDHRDPSRNDSRQVDAKAGGAARPARERAGVSGRG